MSGNLFGWSDDLWKNLDQLGTLVGHIAFLASVTGAVVGYRFRARLAAWLRRNRFPTVNEPPPGEYPWKHVLFVVSREDVPRMAMERYRPESVAFLASAWSANDAQMLEERARALGIRVVGKGEIADADDPAEAKGAALRLLEALSESGDGPVAADVTGGKTAMSIGAFMAAEERGVESIYMTSEYDRENKRIVPNTLRVVGLSRPG